MQVREKNSVILEKSQHPKDELSAITEKKVTENHSNGAEETGERNKKNDVSEFNSWDSDES